MKNIPDTITFFERLLPLVVSGEKVITIRDQSESHYVPGSIVKVYALETGKYYTDIEILSVEPLNYDDISDYHAIQEAMTLDTLKNLIREIYPTEDCLYIIHYRLTNLVR
ncbi:ASCH domain-containing protein [Providencia rustigianii]|uniref:N(4)-acetylcytidine aminohydrolase n=1 Tax=Providencia rustigianii TaxID=158850 RepID=UPI000F71367E|nr:N(4)-acetylcytidine aminohydrolase [Providencia rustigianii]MTC61056.1 ASCH domain-containing protein [Providencia rustigianii]VEH55471.1 ASCH domain [Providencia rustigianii]